MLNVVSLSVCNQLLLPFTASHLPQKVLTWAAAALPKISTAFPLFFLQILHGLVSREHDGVDGVEVHTGRAALSEKPAPVPFELCWLSNVGNHLVREVHT